MGFLRFIKTAWTAAWAIYHFIKEVDRAGVEHFSDVWWLGLRARIIARVLFLARNQDKGWRKLFESDNQGLRGIQLLLKSDTIGEALGEKSIRDARQLLTDAIAEFGRVASATNGSSAVLDLTLIRQKIIEAGTILDAKDSLPGTVAATEMEIRQIGKD